MSDQPIDPAEWYTLEIWLEGELLERGRLSHINYAGMGSLDELIAELGPESLSDYIEDWAIESGLQGEPIEGRVLHGWPWPARPQPVLTHRLEADDEPDDDEPDDDEPDDDEPDDDEPDDDEPDDDEPAAGAAPVGETLTFEATCAYLGQLAAHLRRDIDPQLKLAEGVLRTRELDQQTLSDLARIRELLAAVEAALAALVDALRHRHGHIAAAIDSMSTDPAATGWYRSGT